MYMDKIIDFKFPLYAHKHEIKRFEDDKELLQQHIALCRKYYDILMNRRQLKKKFSRLYQEMGIEEKAALDFLFDALEGVLELHDAGKINPLFQKVKMKNDLGIQSVDGIRGTNHSFFSSLIYLDYFCFQLSQTNLGRDLKKKIKMILFMNAYLISRHHGDLTALEEYIMEYEEGGQAEILMRTLKKHSLCLYKGPFYFMGSGESGEPSEKIDIRIAAGYYKKGRKGFERKENIVLNIYLRLLYSVLTTADYYATSEYENGVDMEPVVCTEQTSDFREAYEKTELLKNIRHYEQVSYGKTIIQSDEAEINEMRTEMFLDAEKTWCLNRDANMFFLEAPTGSGKSNCAMNLSFQMLEENWGKIWYVYPFNTLVEQNYTSLEKIFGMNQELFSKITVINSVTPMKKEEEIQDDEESCYQKALLNRQFLNYPFILTTHVSFFETLFSNRRESVFGFLQLADSVVVLDEIQSYRNEIWSEIINFLNVFAEMLNMKIIIMSATLPNLEVLTDEKSTSVYLIQNRNKYFNHPLFQNRVEILYELLDSELCAESLYEHIVEHTPNGKKVLVEFIKKTTAEKFFRMVCEDKKLFDEVSCLTGDDNIADRKKILNRISNSEGKTILMIATQVIEAGVDIDMDIGYKDISKLDSEEQFMGRINRSCRHKGKVYFFHMDRAGEIYRNDIRVENQEFTLADKGIREILKRKDFDSYYLPVLNVLKNFNKTASGENLETFFNDDVGNHNFYNIEKRMRLIEKNDRNISLYLARKIILENGEILDGWECWKEYKRLLMDYEMGYAKKQYELSVVKSKMNYFIYQVKKNADFNYSEKIGEIYAIQDGEEYFLNGRLDREKLEGDKVSFI